jgi:hypothetical protein
MHSLLVKSAVKQWPERPVAARLGKVVAAAGLAAVLAGCVESLPTAQLPDLVRDPRKFLTKEEQQQAINDLSQKKAAQQADAEKQGEKAK